jgi:hypothetical protein
VNPSAVLSRLQPSPTPPIIVKIIEPKKDTLADVLIGALGLTGVLVLLAIGAAIVFAAVLFWIRRRFPRQSDRFVHIRASKHG